MGLIVIMLGPPGAGKGTQAARLTFERGLVSISTGEILRDAIRAGTSLGTAVRERIDRGELVDDPTMVAIVRERLARPDAEGGCLLDGFPRTVPQAQALDEIVDGEANGPLVIVEVRVPFDELVRRLGRRRVCGECGRNAAPAYLGVRCEACGGALTQRPDDSAVVIEERLRVYERQTFPLVEFYQGRSTFHVVDGSQAPELVARQLSAVLDGAS